VVRSAVPDISIRRTMPHTALILKSRTWSPASLWHGGTGRWWPAIAVLTVLLTGAWLAAEHAGLSHGLLLLVGAGLGFALQRSGFGFAGAWRAAIMDRSGAGLRAQLALLALLTVVFLPLFARGQVFGQPLFDVVRPVGVSLLVGAFLFGIGAQLASACASGSLAGVGNGKLRYLIVVLAMVAGATLGSAHLGWWESRPRWISFSMLREWGPWLGVAGNLTLIGALAGVSVWLEKIRYGHLPRRRTRVAPGSWPMWLGVLVIALLCTATLILAGRPWTIVTALPLWGAKLINVTGLPLDVDFWEYWAADTRIDALAASLWSDVTTLMIGGLVLGTGLAFALSGAARLAWKIRPVEALVAALGGLLLGYGGVVGLGCNIGAFVAGVASGSLHGWIWLIAAFAGTSVGVALRNVGERLRPAG